MSKWVKRKAARSGTQPCPICKASRALVEHHFRGRECPDWDKPWNKGYICPACHDDVHAGKIIIEGWVYTTEGKMLAWHNAGEDPKYIESSEAPLYTQKT